MIESDAVIAIAGAGSVGCYVGGCLTRAGRKVTLLVRPRLGLTIAPAGLRITDIEGRDEHLRPKRFALTADPKAALAGARVILVTVKSRDTEAMAELIALHAPPDAVVVSLQNGVGNADILRRHAGPRQVVPGMVPFNVVQTEIVGMPLKLHRATSGTALVAKGMPGLAALLDVEGFPVAESGKMDAVLWGKLLLNLNNALNALSGLPLKRQLADRRWRFLLADQVEEALAVMRARRVRAARTGGVQPRLLPRLLRLPNWLFGMVARRMLSIDGEARSSMWDDLERGRRTEVEQLQGAILGLARDAGRDAAWNRLVMEMVQEAEAARRGSPRLTPEQVLARLRPPSPGAVPPPGGPPMPLPGSRASQRSP